MRIHLLFIAAVIAAALAAVPAGAFEAKTLEVTVGPSGAADVVMTYDLNPIERFGVYVAIAAPGRALETALGALAGRKVRVSEAGPDGAAFVVPKFATVTHGRDGTVYATPAVDFTAFGRALDRYWFAPFVSPDFSPDSITLTFPDGYRERFDGRTGLPAVTHRA
ncbi:MAG: hypothetical protein ABFC38_06015 [Methanospirillum sp.]